MLAPKERVLSSEDKLYNLFFYPPGAPCIIFLHSEERKREATLGFGSRTQATPSLPPSAHGPPALP